MKDATLAQGNQVLNLILQKQVPAEQIQNIIETGLLSDLLDANVTEVNRERFRKVIGIKRSEGEEERVCNHRLIFKNVAPTQIEVEERMSLAVGQVNILDWYVDKVVPFDGPVPCGDTLLIMPQSMVNVFVEYTKK